MSVLHAGILLGLAWAGVLYAFLAGYGKGWAEARRIFDDGTDQAAAELVRPWREAVVEDGPRVAVLPEDDPTVAHVGPHDGREDY